MSQITTHILDTATGKPASDVEVVLELKDKDGWSKLGSSRTDQDGRVKDLLKEDEKIAPGIYRLTFNTAQYFAALGTQSFYPYVSVVFEIKDSSQHYHVPLLLNPFGYSTYRGS